MIRTSDIEDNVLKYKAYVSQQLETLIYVSEKFEPFKQIDLDLKSCCKLNFEQFDVYHSVYLIMVNDFGAALNGNEFCKRIKKLKDRKSTKYKLPQVNFVNSDSDILYIGKSTGSLKNRLEQHFKGNILTTYALHLSKWEEEKKFEGMKLSLFYSWIDFESCGIFIRQDQKDLLELVETSLHRKYRPLLGRTGH